MLQQRLGTGNNTETYSINAKLNPNLFLPSKWGIKTPVNMTYNRSVSSPKFRPGKRYIGWKYRRCRFFYSKYR